MLSSAKRTPVIIGVGDVKNKSHKVEDAIKPMQLMLEAILTAIKDCSSSKPVQERLQASIDSVSVVATWTWPYNDLPGLVSQELGIQPQRQEYSKHGGNQPIKLVDEAARRISLGESEVALVTGGEALASLSACAAAKKLPPPGWTKPDPSVESSSPLILPNQSENLGATHSAGLPIHIYPLYENGLRARNGQSIEENNEESAQMYAEFAKTAECNPFSWTYGEPALSKKTISTVTSKNRVICFPYPLLMNAFNNVNLATSCILTSTEYARKLGIPESKWIYPLGGAGTQDSEKFWERPNYHSSPSISRSLDACLEISGLTKEQIDMFDFYACFPIVPKLACQHLSLPFINSPKPITLLGGLTSFGGAGNNYSMHALTAMVRQIRKGNAQNGLILANGGVLTYQHAICLSTHPRRDDAPYPDTNPLPSHITDIPVPRIAERAEGEAVIETYTVEFTRTNTPKIGFIIGRLTDYNHRFVANAGDERTLEQLASRDREPIGRKGWVRNGGKAEGGRNLFVFERDGKL